MKYIKPELEFKLIQAKETIAAGVEDWLSGAGEEMKDAGITPFFVTES